MTENSVNEFLAHVSTSALFLNTWNANVNANNTEFRNIYRFLYPVNLIVLHGTCLVAVLIFVVIGLNALRMNGVPGTDGGSLQILTTTTGAMALNRAAAAGSLKATTAMSKELADRIFKL